MIIRIHTAEDPRVTDYARLRDGVLRHRHDVYIAESTLVVQRALEAGHRPKSFFLAERYLPEFEKIMSQHPEVPVYTGTDEVLTAITGFHLHRGALAAVHRPMELKPEQVISGARRVAVLENLVEHTNLGAIFRSAAALGIEAVLLSPECVDPLYRRSIRVSMGAVFSIPYARFEHWPHGLTWLREQGFSTLALTLSPEAVAINTVPASDRLAIVLGTEGQGLSAQALDTVESQALIPMWSGVDSLNVAAAAAVAFWELRSYR